MQIVLALIAAALFALGSVLQQKAGADAPTIGARAGLLFQMVRRPIWLVGVAADGLAFVAQAAALGIGRLAVVQPLLVASVAFALPLGAWISDQRVGRREVIAAIALLAGLTAFIVVADPAGGHDGASPGAWLIAGAACGGPCVALTLLAPRAPGPRRAALLGAAGGILFALSAALTKTVVSELDNGLVTVVTTWPLYGLIAVGYVSMTLNQMSLDAGALAATMATSTALDPIVSVVLGLTLFRESMSASPIEVLVILVALAVIVGAMIVLARDQAQPSSSIASA
ncbi:MAG: DMT family transporter [Solirubrobacteraceae bacterium]